MRHRPRQSDPRRRMHLPPEVPNASDCNCMKRGTISLLTNIADRDINIAICYMTLGEKIRYLREVEGSLRDLGRPMTQSELVRAIRKEQRKSISQSYISQI